MTTTPPQLITARPAPPDARAPLTPIQSKVLDYCVKFLQVNDTFPTLRAIAADFGFRSKNTAADHLKLMEAKGYLTRNEIGTLMLVDRPAATSGVCGWDLDDHDFQFWRSTCGERWDFGSVGLADNRLNYCPHCGGRVHKIQPAEVEQS